MTRGIDQQSDEFYDSVRKVLQETHDSTVRTEMICQSLADKIQMHDALAQQHALKSRTALENFKLLIELDIKVLVPSYWVLMFSGQSLARTLNHPQSSGFGFALLSTQKTVSSSFL